MENSFSTCKTKALTFCKFKIPYEQSIDAYSTLKNDFQFIESSLRQSIQSIEQVQTGLTGKVNEKAQSLVQNMTARIASIKVEILKLKQHQTECSQKH